MPFEHTLLNTRAFRKTLLSICISYAFLFGFQTTIFAQRPAYTINAKLDVFNSTLDAKMEVSYTNHTKIPLDEIAVHLWANAYADRNSPFGQQMLNLGNTSFYFARQNQLGGYQVVKVSSDDQTVNLVYDDKEIAWIKLSEPLAPEKTITFAISFNIKIPASFSRMGRTGDAFQLTQWYPHIAVLDQEGWHTMPYLDQGEFYNDFADYKVTLTVPDSLTVAATGVLKKKSTANHLTTWEFEAENVIDFAWFVDPDFVLEEKTVTLSSDQAVQLKIYRQPSDSLWNAAMAYAERALRFYSDWLGPYPYPTMSVVSAPLSKGGYMEYPMLAQIGIPGSPQFLDIVILHEIGHTWLYGILASNERNDPWMDEGLNTFFERKYVRQHYPEYDEIVYAPEFTGSHSMSQYDALLQHMRFTNLLQPPATNPQFQVDNQYLFSAYLLPAIGLEFMESKVDTTMMKSMFRAYYDSGKFTHVAPVDLRVPFETACKCDLTWFFNDWIHEAHKIDYRIKKFKASAKELTIINKSNIEFPLSISAMNLNKPDIEYWIDGFRDTKTIHLDQRADHVMLNKQNPTINKKWWNQLAPVHLFPRITILPKIGSYSESHLSVTPFICRNVADGIMVGPVLISNLFPQRNLKWTIAPLYGLGSHKVRGYAEARLTANMGLGIFDKMLISASVNHFGYNLDTHYLYRDSYLRLSPSIAFRSRISDQHPHRSQWWKYRMVRVNQFYGNGIDFDNKIYSDEERQYSVHELAWQLRSDYILRPFVALSNVQAGKGFVRLNFNFNQHFTGAKPGSGLWIHAYAGFQPLRDHPDVSTNFTLTGLSSYGFFSTDYMYDQWLGGRNRDAGIFAHQIFLKDAGFKTLATNGISEKSMLAAGLDYALPFKLIHVYMDGAYYKSGITEENVFSYSGGVSIVLLKDVFEVYLPLLESKDIRNSLSYEVRDIWHKRISFQANFRLLNPMDIVDRLELRY